MKQVKWFERQFEFGITENIFPSIVERLTGTPIRLENKIASMSTNQLEIKIDGTWSIKENIGHLTDLETLWQQRFEEIVMGRKVMAVADLTNTKTNVANHNRQAIEVLLDDFRNIRKETISMLDNIDETIIFRSALHPRLNKPMRTMDLFIFVAEHDDHHLSRIAEIMRLPASKKVMFF